jgi:hypothetical protein
MTPTITAMRERVFREARQYREKANVADYCADRAEFARTGQVTLPGPEIATDATRYAVFAVRRLREAIAWLDPSRAIAPVWRLIERGNGVVREMPPKLAILVESLRERPHRSRDAHTRGPQYDR